MNPRTTLAFVTLVPVLLAGCQNNSPKPQGQSKPQPASAAPDAPETGPQPGTLAYDKSVWISLLHDHQKIRREVHHIDNGVEAVTESDDPDVAARIIDHAKAMQLRMKHGSQVRVWDPVFVDLFDNHDKISLEVTPTAKGVRIRETSDDPKVVELLRAHAVGVTDFVNEGTAASQRETPYDWRRPLPAQQ